MNLICSSERPVWGLGQGGPRSGGSYGGGTPLTPPRWTGVADTPPRWTGGADKTMGVGDRRGEEGREGPGHAVVGERTDPQTGGLPAFGQEGEGTEGGAPRPRGGGDVGVVEQHGGAGAAGGLDGGGDGPRVGVGAPVPAPRGPQHRLQPVATGRDER
jgi:hypothetical protein